MPSDLDLELHSLAAVTPTCDRDFPLSRPAAIPACGLRPPFPKFPRRRSKRSLQRALLDVGLLPLVSAVPRGRLRSPAPREPLQRHHRHRKTVVLLRDRRKTRRLSRVRPHPRPRSRVRAVQAKLRPFSSCSKEAFPADVHAFSSGPVLAKLGDFRSPPEIGPPSRSWSRRPPVEAVDEWTRTRADVFVAQASLPLEQRAAHSVTPPVPRAGAGKPEAVFSPGSVAELLFSSGRGKMMPLPFANCRAELPAAFVGRIRAVSLPSICRKAVAEERLHGGGLDGPRCFDGRRFVRDKEDRR
jgi:hypothetical protein